MRKPSKRNLLEALFFAGLAVIVYALARYSVTLALLIGGLIAVVLAVLGLWFMPVKTPNDR